MVRKTVKGLLMLLAASLVLLPTLALAIVNGTPGAIYTPATSTTGKYRVSWSRSATLEVNYILEESTDAAFTAPTAIGMGTLLYKDFTKASGSYWYRVKAVKVGNDPSLYRTATAPVVVTLTATAPTAVYVPTSSSNGKYRVSWTRSLTPGAVYNLYENATGTDPAIYSGPNTYFDLTGKTDGTYSYSVKITAAGYLPSAVRAGANSCVVTVVPGDCGYCHKTSHDVKLTDGVTLNPTPKCATCHGKNAAGHWAVKPAKGGPVHWFGTPVISTGTWTGSAWTGVTTTNGEAQYMYQGKTCASCHDTTSNLTYRNTINEQYAQSGHGDATGEAWTHYDWRQTGTTSTVPGSSNRTGCVRCHTTTGYVAKLGNETSTALVFAAANGDAVKAPEVLSCDGCHSDVKNGTLRVPPATFTVPFTVMAGGGSNIIPDSGKSNLCVRCHGGRGTGASITSADFTSNGRFPSPHYLAAAGTLNNYLGYHFAGRTYTGGGHKNISGSGDGPCVTCHMSDGHGFQASAASAACLECHTDAPAKKDAAYAEFHAALDVLKAALAQYAGAYYNAADGQFKTTDGGTTQKTVYASIPQLGAAFNFYLLDHAEPAAYVHNKSYAMRLIADSIDYLNDNQIDGDLAAAIDALTGVDADTKFEAKDALANFAITAGTFDTGDSTLTKPAEFAGSNACQTCHAKQYAGWSNSLHNKPTKYLANQGETIIVNDRDTDGQNDFVEILDFNTVADLGYTNPFASRIPNAPILKKVGSDYVIQIGTVEYKVNRTQGGNGYWKQRYYTKVGNGNYVLPVQYNEVTKKYTAYNPQYWYDGTTLNQPLFSAAYGSAELVNQFKYRAGTVTDPGGLIVKDANGPASSSWENRCAGCHQSGLKVELVDGEVVSGYADINVGCEACHGPAAAHVAAPSKANIVNPNSLFSAAEYGAEKAVETCGKCHSRMEGFYTGSGTTHEYFTADGVQKIAKNMEAPSRLDAIDKTKAIFPSLGELLYPTFGRDNVGVHGGAGGKTLNKSYANITNFPAYAASVQHHQQWEDMEQGAHGASVGVAGNASMSCWTCHDLHQPAGKHNIKTSMTVDAVKLAVSADDNTLCLACHAGSGDFAALTVAQLKATPTGTDVINAVNNHMAQAAGMDIPAASYLTINTTYGLNSYKNGQCIGCHMPYTVSSSGIWYPDAGAIVAGGTNKQQGDIRSHTMKPVQSAPGGAVTAPTSCTGCH